MTSRYRHRRTPLTATPFPSPIEPGEIVVNTANRQIAVGDAAAGTLGQPKPLIGVRFFDPTASYVLNDVVTQTGKVWRANGSIAPGAFNAANWTEIGAGGTAAGVASDPVGNVAATNVQAAIAELDAEKVRKAGDSMSGHLSLPTAPAADQAVRRDYVDAADAGLQTDVNAKADTSYVDGADALKADKTYVDAVDALKADKTYVDAADALKAPLASPTFTGDPKAPTPTAGDNDTSIATTAFVTAAVASASGSVRYDAAQSLTAAQQQQARQNIYAAPFDALAYSGMQVNGSMEVSQEFGGTGVTPPNATNKYVIDGWKIGSAGPQVMLAFQNPNQGLSTPCLQVTVSTANASPAAGDVAYLTHLIEGYRVGRLAFGTANASPLTLAFWVRAVRPGNYSGSINNAALDRSYPFSFTVNASNVWEYKTVTIPGDTTGTWAKDNTIGMWLFFCLMSGASRLSSANSWQAGQFFGVTGTINGVAATTDGFAVSGVTVLPGSEAPSAARSPFIMRPYGQELLTCKRYFYNGVPPLIGVASSASTLGRASCRHPVPMRAAPTLTVTSTITFFDGTGVMTVSAVSTNHSSVDAIQFDVSSMTGPTATYRPMIALLPSGGNLNVDARL